MSSQQKDAYYFSHDANARHDPKIVKLRRSMGIEGYGIYFMIIEYLREQNEYKLKLSSIPDFAYEIQTEESKVSQLVNDFDLFTIEGDSFYSNRLKRSMDQLNEKRRKLSESGKNGNAKRWGKTQPDSQTITKVSPPDLNPIALKESKVKEIKEKNSKKFIPPTLDEVKEYFKENGYREEVAIKAYNYYKEGNWIDGQGNNVLNWKQKMLAVWLKEENLIPTQKPRKFVA